MLLDAVEKDHGEVAASKGLAIRREVRPGLPGCLRGDPIRLAQILGHLLGNAIKFSNGGTITLRVAPEKTASQLPLLRFEVADQGVGIPDDLQGGLFTLFHQADNSSTRRFGGTGLGLALCKRLVDLMGGEIGFVSQVGQGSTFWFRIPLSAVARPAAGHGPSGESRELPPVAASASVPGAAPDWPLILELLSVGDMAAGRLCEQHRAALDAVLGEHRAAFWRGMAAFDFEAAQQLLQDSLAREPQAVDS